MKIKKTKQLQTLSNLNTSASLTAQYKKEMDKLLKEMRKSVDYFLLRSYQKNEDAIVQDSAFSSINEQFDKLYKRWFKIYDRFAERFAPNFIRKVTHDTRTRITKEFHKSGFKISRFANNRHYTNVANALVTENVNLIKTIASQYLDNVQGIVMRGITLGHDVKFIQKELKKRYAITERRANFIASDQTHKATQAIQRTCDQQLGITQGIWVHRAGSKSSRLTHQEMNGKTFDLTKGLYDSDVKREVLPAELYGCRCTYHRILPELLRK